MNIPNINIDKRILIPLALGIILIVGVGTYYLIKRHNKNDTRQAANSKTDTLIDQKSREPTPLLANSVRISAPIKLTSFFETRNGGFDTGHIVGPNLKNIKEVSPGTVLYTVTQKINGYHSRGLIRETRRAYEPSPYAGFFVFLDRLSGIQESKPEKEYFVFQVSSSLTTPITVTGWKVFDRDKKIAYSLPSGNKILNTQGTADNTPITAEAGETFVISSGRSPVGSSFLINKCSGFRSQFKKFTPTVKTECPDPNKEFTLDGSVPYADSQCYEMVKRLDKCTTVTAIPDDVSKECRTFLKSTLTESGCVLFHRNDPDFFTKEWRVFLEAESELWKNSENMLYLLDEKDRLVAALIY